MATLGVEEQRQVVRDFTKIVPHLSQRLGVVFHGRILEIGAGDAWLSAELSKQPRVVEILSVGLSSKLLAEESPRLCKLLKAHESKITWLPLKAPRLDLPDEKLTWQCEQMVRNYDPCISCATHFLKLKRERG